MARLEDDSIYHDLDPVLRQIRLVHIFPPKSTDDPVECNLNIISLDSKPSFEALSYVWGDSEATKPLKLDKGLF